MVITEALIERFFNNDCDEAEQQAVKNYFIQHPEVLRKYMTEQSWHTFESHEPLAEPISEKMLAVVRQHTYHRRKTIIARWWYAAAAVMMLSLGTYWFTRFNGVLPKKVIAKKTTIPSAPTRPFRITSNTSVKPLFVMLEDGTRVKLAPQSSLEYAVPFENDRRNCRLKGQAIFYVAKDASRPFTVYAGKLTTTAIGTVFRITAFDGRTTSVHLLSGKVRVAADSSIQLRGTSITYLLPGQELQLDVLQHLVLLNPKEKDKAHKPAMISRPSTRKPERPILVFHNEPLEQIFTTLSEKYPAKISFRPEQLSGMTFTGKYDHRKEALIQFIQTISLLNNLVIREESGTIIIESQ